MNTEISEIQIDLSEWFTIDYCRVQLSVLVIWGADNNNTVDMICTSSWLNISSSFM